MKQWVILVFVIFWISILLSCNSRNTRTTEIKSKAGSIVQKSIKFTDPSDLYSSIKSIDYTKTTKLYNEWGGMEDSIYQYHHYDFSPELSGSIKWTKNNIEHTISYKEGKTSKYVDNIQLTDSLEIASAYSSMMASVYVMMMPFKLQDPGTKMEYTGRQVIPMVGPSDIIHVKYDAELNENHTQNDLWWYYFDPETYKFLGNKVFHNNGASLIVNNKDQEISGIKFHHYRKSYKFDNADQIDRLRAEYYYENISLEFHD